MMMARSFLICVLLMLVGPSAGSSSTEATVAEVDKDNETVVDQKEEDKSTKNEEEKEGENEIDAKDDQEPAESGKVNDTRFSDKDEGSSDKKIYAATEMPAKKAGADTAAEDEDASKKDEEDEEDIKAKKENDVSKDKEETESKQEREPVDELDKEKKTDGDEKDEKKDEKKDEGEFSDKKKKDASEDDVKNRRDLAPKLPNNVVVDPDTKEELDKRLKEAQEALEEAHKAIASVQQAMDDAEETKKERKKEVNSLVGGIFVGGIDYQLIKEVAIPIVAFAIGAVLHQRESTAVYGKLAMFFGAQTVMNLYMKQVLSGSVVDEEEGLKGIPSAFIITALQQLVAFLLFGTIILILLPTPYRYTPKKLNDKMEVLAVILFSFSFTMNIALNNFSISLLPLSVNLIIRSCLPLATFITQRTASKCTNQPVKDARMIELLFMVLGVCCAIVAVIAKSHVASKGNAETKTLAFGIVVCVASLFSGAINLALAGVLGTSCKLNSLDTTVYMSIPAFLFLIPPSLFYWHPVSWPGWTTATDREIFMVVLDRNPSVIFLAAFSGVLAFFYNVFQYGIVHSLSASYTAFAGNFNKAATIALGIIVGLESLPPGFWGTVMICACIGNIAAFTAFNIVKMQAPKDEEGGGEEKNGLIAENKA